MTSNMHIALLGCGNMGQAMLRQWLLTPDLGDTQFHVIDPHISFDAFTDGIPNTAENRIHLYKDAQDFSDSNLTSLEAFVIAIKPQSIPNVLPKYAPILPQKTLVISIAAGVPIKAIRMLLNSGCPIIRAMPNTPFMVGAGITALFAGAEVTKAQRTLASTLFSGGGEVCWLALEDDLHAVTAVSGSGPAYVFALTEALAKAAEDSGLSPALAATLARQQ